MAKYWQEPIQRVASSRIPPQESQIIEDILTGSEIEKQSALQDLVAYTHLDRTQLRQLLTDALAREYSSADEGPECKAVNDARSWLFAALARLSDNDTDASRLARQHLSPASEPDWQVRYRTFEGLVAVKAPDLADIARRLQHDDVVAIRLLAKATLAASGHDECSNELVQALEENQTPTQMAALQALQQVSLKAAVKPLCNIVDLSDLSRTTELAIRALARVRHKKQVLAAQKSLTNFVQKNGHNSEWEAMVNQAKAILDSLKFQPPAAQLIKRNETEATTGQAEIASSLGDAGKVSRMLATASRTPDTELDSAAAQLRVLEAETVQKALEQTSFSGPSELKQTARKLQMKLRDHGTGEQLQKGSINMEKVLERGNESEQKLRELFDVSFREARDDFKLTARMGLVVFALGISLVACSAWLVLSRGGTLEGWRGVTAIGVVGIAGVVYGTMVARPRRQVQRSAEHLMYLKAVLLAFSRQLNQTEQAYSRRLMEEEPMVPQEVDEFSKMVGSAMQVAVGHLGSTNGHGSRKEFAARS